MSVFDLFKRTPATYMEQRKHQHRKERAAAATASAKRQAGTMTRGERDALRRKPTRVDLGSTEVRFGGRTFHRQVSTHTNPAKAAARADRTARKAERRQQNRGR